MKPRACLLLPIFLVVSMAPPVFASTITVDSTSDSGAPVVGSLRWAIQTAQPGDTIQFNLPTPSTIMLSAGSLNIDRNLTITGPGAGSLTIDASSNLQGERAFSIATGNTVSITNLTITGGRGGGSFANSTNTGGGAVFNAGTLSLTGVVLSNNSVRNTDIGGGAIFNAGNATLTLTNCTVTGNTAGGGQIPNNGPISGGAIRSANGTTLTLTNTTISNNTAHVGGGIWSNGTLTISGSTFSGNSAGVGVSTPDDLDGGAIYVVGSGTASIVNSTLSGNAAKSRGGAVAGVGNVGISNSTLSGNTTDLGGGAVSALGAGRTVGLKGNILSNAQNCFASGGTISSSGYNVATDATCSLNGQGDAPNTAAGLDPSGLQDNGGPTRTIALLSTSTAKDRIPPAFCTALDNATLTTDQRGTTRPQGTNCDSGSFELNQASSFTVTNTSDSGAGSLRQAIQDANASSTAVTINFDLTYPATITLTGGTLNVTQSVTIHGPGANDLTIDGNHNLQILSIASGKDVVISGLKFANGSNDNGGAIFNSGNVVISESVFTGNNSLQGGAINNQSGGTVAVSDTTFSANSANNFGGGLFNLGTAMVTRTTFSDNTGGEAAGAFNGGTMTIVNSTFAGNQASAGAGALENNLTLHLTNGTFFNNSGGAGFGAFYNIQGAATIKGTLLAKGPSNGTNCALNFGSVTSGGYNLSDDTSCSAIGLNAPTDRNNTAADLDPLGLQDNGGPTKTVRLKPTSIAVNAIPASCTDVNGGALSTDQRGIVRPVGGGCEIGSFEVDQQAPIIASFNPTSGSVGTSVTVTGTSFTGVSSVTFNGTSATGFTNSDTEIFVTVPAGATTGPISVTAPGGTATSSSNFTVVAAAPTISNFSPTSGPVGTSVTITGTDFTGASAVTFGATAATFTVNTPTQITATVPSGATTGQIAVTTAAGTATSADNFTVTVGPSPTVTSFSPGSGVVGTLVTINGTNFAGTTSVAFGGASTNQLTVANSGKKITVTVPAGATTGPIAVTTPGGTATSATNFTIVNQPPTITSFTPTSGKAGTQVQIVGSNFIGVTSVMFGGLDAKFTVVDQSHILATVPNFKLPPGSNAKVVISVTNPVGTATSPPASFTVTK